LRGASQNTTGSRALQSADAAILIQRRNPTIARDGITRAAVGMT
jgi:hypothetical protein